jgi:hypothetical protein
MVFEVLGFVTGALAAGGAWVILLRHERWRTIRAVYGGRPSGHSARNALIWPSR